MVGGGVEAAPARAQVATAGPRPHRTAVGVEPALREQLRDLVAQERRRVGVAVAHPAGGSVVELHCQDERRRTRIDRGGDEVAEAEVAEGGCAGARAVQHDENGEAGSAAVGGASGVNRSTSRPTWRPRRPTPAAWSPRQRRNETPRLPAQCHPAGGTMTQTAAAARATRRAPAPPARSPRQGRSWPRWIALRSRPYGMVGARSVTDKELLLSNAVATGATKNRSSASLPEDVDDLGPARRRAPRGTGGAEKGDHGRPAWPRAQHDGTRARRRSTRRRPRS